MILFFVEWGPPEDSEMQKVTNSLKNNLICILYLKTLAWLYDSPMFLKKKKKYMVDNHVTVIDYYDPPRRVRRHIAFPCPSVCPSVCLFVRHKSCLLYNSKTVKDISVKLDTLIKQDETICHTQEP